METIADDRPKGDAYTASSKPKKFSEAEVLTALCVWEEMLERHMTDEQLLNVDEEDHPWRDMTVLWGNVGTVAMRQFAADIGRLLDQVWAQFDNEVDRLDLVPFDWEFVPYVLGNYVEWTTTGWVLAHPVDKLSNVIRAERALRGGAAHA